VNTDDAHRRAAALHLLRKMAAPAPEGLALLDAVRHEGDRWWSTTILAELDELRTANAALVDAARRVLDGHLHRAVIRQSDLDNLTRLDDIVARLVPTREQAAGCPVSPDDPQTRDEHEGGAPPG
jgi:hypothetical protein